MSYASIAASDGAERAIITIARNFEFRATGFTGRGWANNAMSVDDIVIDRRARLATLPRIRIQQGRRDGAERRARP